MVEIGGFRSRGCQGGSRRAFLQAGPLSPIALSLANPARAAEVMQRAKSVLLLWLWGAPSHIDTFDPKPNAPLEIRGPFSTIATRTPGVRFTELLPKIAARSDRFAIVRSNKNFHSGHLEAGTIGLTGAADDKDAGMPNFGSIVARHRGAAKLPPFIA